MTLHDYLILTKTTEVAFAEAVGISQPHVGRLRRGKHWPSRKLMRRISEVTNDAVKPEDFMPCEVAA